MTNNSENALKNVTVFVGRNKELEQLRSKIAKKDGAAQVLVLTGRRRVGKSTLIEHFGAQQNTFNFYQLVGLPPSPGERLATELSNIAQQISATFDMPKPQLRDWDEALWTTARYLENGNCILMIDEINWFGKRHGDIGGALFTLWESKLKHIKGFTLILTGSLAGWIKTNIIESQGWYGRLAWEKNLQPLPLTDALKMIPQPIRKRRTIMEQIGYLLVSGGIPRYLEAFRFENSLEDNLKELAWSSDGYFFREYDELMRDLFRAKWSRVDKILSILAEGKKTVVEIASKLKLKKPNGNLYQDLEMMEQSAFIRGIQPWDLEKGTFDTKNTQYAIVDPYLRFYLKAILPHKKAIQQGHARLPDNLDSLLGFQFEYLLRENLELLYKAIKINGEDVLNAAPYQTKGLQIDLLIETRRYFTIVEMKFQRKPLSSDIIRQMEQILDRFPCPANKNIKTAVVQVSGAEEKVINSDAIDICVNIADFLQ